MTGAISRWLSSACHSTVFCGYLNYSRFKSLLAVETVLELLHFEL